MSEENNAVVEAELEVDTQLVDKVCDTITSIFSKHAEEAVKEIGQLCSYKYL